MATKFICGFGNYSLGAEASSFFPSNDESGVVETEAPGIDVATILAMIHCIGRSVGAMMTSSFRAILLAAAATIGAAVYTPASAAAVVVEPPTASDFAFSESDGVYTIYNYTTDWYIWGFDITNPLAVVGATVGTTQTDWTADVCTNGALCQAGADSFEYQNINGAYSDLGNDVGPISSSSNFTFGAPSASNGYFLVTNGDTTYDISGVSELSGVPEPSTWAMILIGFAGLGYLGYRKSRKGCASTVAA